MILAFVLIIGMNVRLLISPEDVQKNVIPSSVIVSEMTQCACRENSALVGYSLIH